MMTTMVIMILIMIIKFGDLLMIAMMMTATTIGDLNLPISIGMILTEGGGFHSPVFLHYIFERPEEILLKVKVRQLAFF